MRRNPGTRRAVWRLGLLAALLAASVPLAAQRGAGDRIPDDPRQLRFEPRPFVVPDGDALRHELPSGAVVYVVEDRSLPLVEIVAASRVGAWLEPPEQTGLASLTAAMIRRGGAGGRDAAAFDRAVDGLGAQMQAVSGDLRSGASLDCATWVLEEALDLYFEMLAQPRFEPASLELARSNLAGSLRHRTDDPQAVVEREWGRLLFGEGHLATRELTPAALAAIGRAEMVAFHRRYWRPERMVFAVSGDVDTAAILASLERRIAAWRAALLDLNAEAAPELPWPPTMPAHQPVPGLYHVERDIPQAKVLLGHRSTVRERWDSPEFFVLTVMNELLGGGELVSRLGGRLRTVEGLVYRAGSRFVVGDYWPGDFQVHLDTANATAARAIELAIEEIGRLRRRAPSAEEMAQVQRGLTSVVPLLFDSASEVAGYFAEDELLGRPHRFWRDYRAGIEAVTGEQVRAAAERYLDPERLVIVVGGRWRELAAGDPAAWSRFGPVTHLPERDPLTLRPVLQRPQP